MWHFLQLKLNKRIIFAGQVALFVLLGLGIVVGSCWIGSKLLSFRFAGPKIRVAQVTPGARVVVMPMISRMHTSAGRSSSSMNAMPAVGDGRVQAPAVVQPTPACATPATPSAVVPKPIQRLKKLTARQRKQQQGMEQKARALAKKTAATSKKKKQEKVSAATKKKEVVKPVVTTKPLATQPAVLPEKMGPPTVCQTASVPVATAAMPCVAAAEVGQELLGLEHTIIVGSAAELHAVRAVQEMVVGLQTLWHPPVDMVPKQPLIVQIAFDAQGKGKVATVKQSSGILIYDMQAKQAIMQLEPIASAAGMTLTLEF